MKHVFIIGARSLGQYGGFETFLDRLTEQHAADPDIQYHIACRANGPGAMDEAKLQGVQITEVNSAGEVTEFVCRNARVFKIHCPDIGPAAAVWYDCAAVNRCLRYCREHRIERPVFYILACRIGPFIGGLAKRIHAVGGRYYLNPDGHEWLRAKWSRPVRAYWKWSEKQMVLAADTVICDSVSIRQYIQAEYRHPDTAFIAYGADVRPSVLRDEDPAFTGWLREKGLRPGGYFLVVGRLVPENNYETMIREFLRSNTRKSLVMVTNRNDALKRKLEASLHFSGDDRIRFAGTVYDRELLKKIRENACAYLHGHEVGGTNPSLLEALGSTELNLLLDVGFNREVGQDAALYWTKEPGSLAALLERADAMPADGRARYGEAAKARIRAAYSWEHIASEYKRIWMS